MGLFRRRLPASEAPAQPAAAPATLDLGEALNIVLVKSVESQAGLASKIGELVSDQIRSLSEIQINAYERAAKKRGGKARAKTAVRVKGRYVRCRLCANPAIPDPTGPEIAAHINHHVALPPPEAEQQVSEYRVENGAVRVDVGETHIQQDAMGNEVLECPDCAQGVPHKHGVN